MLPIKLKITDKYTTYRSVAQKIWLAGAVLKDETALSPQLLLSQLESLKAAEIADYVEQLDGFFSVIWCTERCVYLISDRLRSYPLFYSAAGSELWVSDDIELLVSERGLAEGNALARAEFLQLGYVSGAATTQAGINQVPASAWVEWDGAEAALHCYFQFLPLSAPQDDLVGLKQQLSLMMQRLTRQLIEMANGRQIVVPLSGGFDSKALLLCLYQAGYPNICCFTFGAKDSWELSSARQLAAALGVVWHPVYYNTQTFKQLRTDAGFAAYQQFIHSGVSVPNVQVFPAIRELTAAGIVQPDALLLPGHSADFVSGSHRTAQPDDGANAADLAAKWLWRTHYQLRRDCALQEQLQARLRDQLQHIAAEYPGINAADLAEAWNFRERQAKLIVNSNRYYEFFGLAWWMPFWQRDFVRFWLRVPQQYRLKQLLWHQWVNELLLELLPGYQAPEPPKKMHRVWQRLKVVLDYFTDRNRLLTVVPFSRWLLYRLRLSKSSGNLFGYLADKTLSLADQHRYHNARNQAAQSTTQDK